MFENMKIKPQKGSRVNSHTSNSILNTYLKQDNTNMLQLSNIRRFGHEIPEILIDKMQIYYLDLWWKADTEYTRCELTHDQSFNINLFAKKVTIDEKDEIKSNDRNLKEKLMYTFKPMDSIDVNIECNRFKQHFLYFTKNNNKNQIFGSNVKKYNCNWGKIHLKDFDKYNYYFAFASRVCDCAFSTGFSFRCSIS